MTDVQPLSPRYSIPVVEAAIKPTRAIQTSPGLLATIETSGSGNQGLLATVRKAADSFQQFHSAVRLVRSGRNDGAGIIASAQEYGGQVAQGYSLLKGLAQSPDGQAIIDVIGSFAKEYADGKLTPEALQAGARLLNIKPDLAPYVRANHLLDAGWTYVNSGLRKEAFFSSIAESAAQAKAVSGGTSPAPGNIASTGGNVVGVVGAAYGAYDFFKNWGKMSPQDGAIKGLTAGATVGSFFGPWGTVIGGAVGGIAGAAQGLFGSSKSEDRAARDSVRAAMKQAGMIDDRYCLTLADGSKYDIGKDGKDTLVNADGSERNQFDVDFSHPFAGSVVAMANPLAAIVTGGSKKLTTQFAGYFTNAALSNARTLDDAKANLQAIYASMRIDPEAAMQGIAALQQGGQLSTREAQAYAGGFAMMFDREALRHAA